MTKVPETPTIVSVRLPRDLVREIDAAAVADRRKRSAFIALLLQDGLASRRAKSKSKGSVFQ